MIKHLNSDFCNSHKRTSQSYLFKYSSNVIKQMVYQQPHNNKAEFN